MRQVVRFNTRCTCVADHKPPRGARTPLALRAVAMPTLVSTPSALMLVMICRTLAANASARACLTAVAVAWPVGCLVLGSLITLPCSTVRELPRLQPGCP